MRKKEIKKININFKIQGIREALRYMYHRFNRFYGRFNSDNSPYSGYSLVCVFVFLNLFTIFNIVQSYFRLNLSKLKIDFIEKNISFLDTSLVFFLLFLIIFHFSMKYVLEKEVPTYEVDRKFNQEPPSLRKIRGWFILLYMFLTLILFFISIIIFKHYLK
ncbi:hypothetical protein CAPN005_09170 [Capnocytophaga cynodegmi]|nr:hypothetical protein CAPN005_09170 [Capnocytophaga cynodegmi]